MLQSRAGRSFRTFSVAVVALSFSTQAAAAQGITFDMTSRTSASVPLPGGAGAVVLTARGSASNAGTRVEFVAVENAPGYATGDYMLTTGTGMVLVHPASKTYVDVLDQAATTLNNLPPEVLAQMNISNITGTSEKVAGSESIEGRPTEHHRTVIGYSMNLMGQTIPTTVTSDYWLAKLPVSITNPLAGGGTSSVTSGPMAELMKKQIEFSPKVTDGVAVKMIVATSAAFNGQSMVTTITTEMKNIKEGAVDPATLVLPAGYTKVAK